MGLLSGGGMHVVVVGRAHDPLTLGNHPPRPNPAPQHPAVDLPKLPPPPSF